MKPYDLSDKIRFPGKKDYHPKKGFINWWENFANYKSRRKIKQEIQKEIENEK
jgi:hypothetical protein